MKTQNELKLIMPSRSANESLARVSVAALATQLDPTVEEICDIKTSVSEAVTNCIVHAYKNTLGVINITARILAGNILYIRIKDNGCGITDVKQAMEPMFTTAEGEERAGLGFAVMQSFMDNLKVTSRIGRGTTVTMTKRINSRSGNE